jgi:hypothetical protein
MIYQEAKEAPSASHRDMKRPILRQGVGDAVRSTKVSISWYEAEKEWFTVMLFRIGSK